jgi:uncharacterized protein (TIGR02217 family)
MPTAFHEVRFPLDYAQGVSGGPMYSTRVTVVDSGDEQRVQMWSNGRLSFDIGYTDDPTGMAVVIAFFRARKGRTFGFRLRDWSDYQASAEPLVAGPTMQLQKTYVDAFNAEVRTIKKPCNDGSFVLFDNGSPTAATVDWTTGIVTPTVYNAGHTYSWSGNFDVPVRFDVDKLVYIQDNVGSRTIQSLPVVEVLV